jgi:AraC-like DNA-binding protein
MHSELGLRVEVMGSYSNPSLTNRFRTILAGRNDDRVSDRSPSIVSRKRHKQNQVRLTDEELDVVVAGYEAGLTLNELSSELRPDRRTLAEQLEARGIQRRGRRLTDLQIEDAARLYEQGWSLARIAERFEVRSESIRYRLRQAGVPLRGRNGWQYE